MTDEPAEPRTPRLALSTRLTVAAILAALLPFCVGAAVVALAPRSAIERLVHADQDVALQVAAAEIGQLRSELRERVAGIDDRTLAAAIRTKNERALTRRLGSFADDVEVVFRADVTPRASDGPVAAYASIGDRAGGGGVVVVRRLTAADLDLLATRTGFAVWLLDGSAVAARSADASERIRRVGAEGTRIPVGDDVVVRGTELDERGRSLLVVGTHGSRYQLLASARGEEIGIVLALLIAIGLCTALVAAMVVGRHLRGVATLAQQLAAGNYATRMPVVGRDAGAVVARSYNHLAAELQRRIGHLQTAFDRLDRTLESIEDGVCLWGADGQLLVWNRRAEEITGVDHDAAREGVGAAAFLHDERRPGRRRVMLPVGGEEEHSTAVELVVRRTRDGGVLQVFHDATRTISIEQARRNFLITAAHELRTPLTSIAGFAATLADPQMQLSDRERAAALQQINEDTQRLQGLVERFFESSLLATDRIDVVVGPVDVADAVGVAAETVLPSGARLVVDVPTSTTVLADRAALVRALAGVLDNAAKYGGEPIEVRASAEDGCVVVLVRDHGESGVPLELRDEVFEPFFRIDPEMRAAAGGSGLGLYVSRRLLEAMNATISLEDPAAGRGTVVRIALPVHTPAAAPDADPGSDGGSEPAPAPLAGGR